MKIRTTATDPTDMPTMPTDPISWLKFITDLAIPHPKLISATQRRIGQLSPVEAIAALALLALDETGKSTSTDHTVTSAQITTAAGRSIQIKTMYSLRGKSFITEVIPSSGVANSLHGNRRHRHHLWRLTHRPSQRLFKSATSYPRLSLESLSGATRCVPKVLKMRDLGVHKAAYPAKR